MAACLVGILVTVAVLLGGRSRAGMPLTQPHDRRDGWPWRRWSRWVWERAPGRARARERRRVALAAQLCQTLDLSVAGLRAGLDLSSVLHFAATEGEAGDDVLGLLRESTDRPPTGHRIGAVVRQTREISASAGVPLADAWEAAASLIREEESLRRKVAVALAGPRATMRILTVLPLGGPAVGAAFGIDPWTLYAGSSAAVICLCLGLVLLGVGRWWCGHLIRRLGLDGLT